MHSHIVVSPDETDMEAVHLFRFEGDKIVGLRDGGQPVPADSPHTDSMFWDGGIIMTGDKSKAQAPEQAPRRNPTVLAGKPVRARFAREKQAGRMT